MDLGPTQRSVVSSARTLSKQGSIHRFQGLGHERNFLGGVTTTEVTSQHFSLRIQLLKAALSIALGFTPLLGTCHFLPRD